ncbi:MAG TPA: transglycosylase SLT domain-containing protein, partial [Gammaproteobacteria bacterium]|nr:transglycosylase SLT domain-containing protein [Gammaproteobacteria bacterium]
MNVDTARVLSPLRAATGIVVLTALFALGGCGLITRPAPPPAASSAADNEPEPPPPEADTATAQPPEDWQALDQDTGPQPPPVVTQAPAAPPPPPEDLWQRLRTHFSLPDVDNARVERELHWYATHEAYMQRVADRARPYLYYIVEQLAARNMPVDFALLPIVESAYDPFAYSRGRAAGLWQFIPSTGKRFDLRQNWWYDGRRDVAASTRAALDYLQYLHNKFDGNWLLALAAYNSGSGAVRYAIRKNERRGKPTDFWHLDLPRETRAYVPRLLAVRDLV